MKKLVVLAALACALAAMPSVPQRAYACTTSGCATDDSTTTQVPAATDQTNSAAKGDRLDRGVQQACPSMNCATPEPTPTQVAGPCSGSNCATPEPAPTQVADPCSGRGCATPEQPKMQTAYPCGNSNCATPEPAKVQVAGPCPAVNCATPEGDHPARAAASLSPGGAALGKAVRAVKERIRQQRTGCATSNC
jgi:hypothetical protein